MEKGETPARAWHCGGRGNYVTDSEGGQTSGVNSRVHEGGQAEVGQDEEEDQAIVERHSGGDDLRQPGAPAETEAEGQFQVSAGVRKLRPRGHKRPDRLFIPACST